MIYGTRITTLCIAIFFSLSLAASAGEVPDLIMFENGTQANADQVNTNFGDIKKAVNDNDKRITALSQPRSASVTYSAMGFSPGIGRAKKDFNIGNTYFVSDYTTEFEKTELGLKVNEDNGGAFYHSVSLHSGITITHIRAHLQDLDEEENQALTIRLMKKELNKDFEELTSVTTDGSSDTGEQILTSDAISELIDNNPVSYFIQVLFSNMNQYLHSVTIDYTYSEP